MRPASMRWFLALAIPVAVLCLTIFSGCKDGARSSWTGGQIAHGGGAMSAQDLPMELTYPQSDDQGRYVNVARSGSVVVSGVVSSPRPPTRLLVNGTATRPYEVEDITPYGEDIGYPTYRFHCPVLLAPQTRIVVQVIEPYPSREIVFVPDYVGTMSRWQTLAHRYPARQCYAARLGRVYYARNDYAVAAHYLRRAIEIDRNSPWALLDLGMVYLALNRYDDSVHCFDGARLVYRRCPDLYYGYGMVYYRRHDYLRAREHLARCRDMAPGWAEPLLALGLSDYARRDFAAAEWACYRATTVWPEWAPPRYALASTCLETGRIDEGMRVLREAERLGPWRPSQHLYLAGQLADRGHYDLAWRQVQFARTLGHDAPEPLARRLRARAADPGQLRDLPWQRPEHPGRLAQLWSRKDGRRETGTWNQNGIDRRGNAERQILPVQKQHRGGDVAGWWKNRHKADAMAARPGQARRRDSVRIAERFPAPRERADRGHGVRPVAGPAQTWPKARLQREVSRQEPKPAQAPRWQNQRPEHARHEQAQRSPARHEQVARPVESFQRPRHEVAQRQPGRQPMQAWSQQAARQPRVERQPREQLRREIRQPAPLQRPQPQRVQRAERPQPPRETRQPHVQRLERAPQRVERKSQPRQERQGGDRKQAQSETRQGKHGGRG